MPLSGIAETGFSASAAYDANRPGYPAEAVEKFLEELGIKGKTGAVIVDLAAGTGKFTEILSARPEKFDVTAVEPHPGMRDQLSKKGLAGVTVVDGTAENMSAIADSSVAAVISAQAFHWFANMDTLREVHRVLQPSGGVLGVIWNIEDYQTPISWNIHDGWERVMRDEMYKLDDGLPRFRNGQWKKVFDEQCQSDSSSSNSAAQLFDLPIGEKSMDTELYISKEALWERFKTYSQVANLEDQRRAEFEKIFWDAVNAPETQVDAEGYVAVHNKVIWAWTNKISS